MITQIALAKTVTVVAIALAKTVANNDSRLDKKSPGNRVALLNHQSIKNNIKSTFKFRITKKVFVFVLLFQAVALASFAQTDTTKIEQYCQVIVTPRLMSNKVTIDIDFGAEKSVWTDNRVRTYDGNLKKFNTVVDAMNFMGKEGWVFINAYPVFNGSLNVYHFAFKKQFTKAEIEDSNYSAYKNK